MEAIFDELKQYNLKRIIDIKNISFEFGYTLLDKYYLLVLIHNNIIILLNIFRQVPKYNMCRILQNEKIHLYEIEHNFEIQNICDIFYNFCLNNFLNSINSINSIMRTEQLHLHLHTAYGVDQVEIRIYGDCDSSNYSKQITISNLNEMNLYYNAIIEHEKSTIISVIFEQN